MYNAFSTPLALAACALLLAACAKQDPDKLAADDLIGRIEIELQASRPISAMALMDSVDKLYPSQIEARRKVTAMRPKAIEMASIEQIAKADSIIAATQLQLAELEPRMKHIDGGDLDGYYVADGAGKGAFMNATGIQARVNDDNFTFYIVAQTRGKKIGINQIALNTATGEMLSQQLPAGSARVVEIEGSELATFLAEEVADLGAWAADNAADIKGAMIYGAKGSQRVALTPDQARAIAAAWQYSSAKMRHTNALMLREKLDRQLQVARDQIANTALSID